MFISNMLEIQGIAHQQNHLKESFGFIRKPTRMPTVPYDTISLLFSIRKMVWPLIRKKRILFIQGCFVQSLVVRV